jgi:acyl-CoA reductase-like NAD-dependent aldehyde dehydrogenase
MDMRIGGAFTSSESELSFSVMNPAYNTVHESVPLSSHADVRHAVLSAQDAFAIWSAEEPVFRAKVLFHAAERVRSESTTLASLLTQEQGKPLRESINEIQGFSRVLEYYASICSHIQGDYSYSKAYGHSFTVKRPIGVCAAIIPWNLPALIMSWKVGSALAAGCTVVLKPASTAPLTCLRLGKILDESGLTPGALNIITGPGRVVGEALATNPDICAVSFTGEAETGKHLAQKVSPFHKRLTLELGGSDPMIVCADASIAQAVAGALAGRFFNCGQTCVAVKRLFVDASIYDTFIQELISAMQHIVPGDGMHPQTTMGPLNNLAQKEIVSRQVQDTIDAKQGFIRYQGTLGEHADPSGFFFPPILLTDLSPDAPVMQQEVFGPVLPVVPFTSIDEAIDLANDTKYGLGASIWTTQLETVHMIAPSLRSGVVWVNQHLKVPPEIPFGGVKESGFGRENGPRALDHFLEEKSVLIKL